MKRRSAINGGRLSAFGPAGGAELASGLYLAPGFPRLGEKSVTEVTSPDVIDVLRPIWHSSPTTARRVRRVRQPIPDGARQAAQEHGAVGAAQGPRHRRGAARFPFELPRLGGGETDHPREVVEAALAHAVRNQTEAAYARSDLFARRRRLMDEWGRLPGRRGETGKTEAADAP